MEETLARFLIERRKLLFVLSLLFVGLMAWGAKFLYFESDYKIFFNEDYPPRVAHEEIQDEYTRSDNVLLIIAPDNGEVFSRPTLEMIRWLTDRAWEIPRAIRVDSLTNFQHTRAQEDDLLVADLVSDPQQMSDAELQLARKIAVSEPLLVNNLISPKAHVAAINVRLNMPEDMNEFQAESLKIHEYVDDLRRQASEKYPAVDIHLQGQIIINRAFNDAAEHDASTLMPMMFLLVILLLLIFLRSFSGTGATLLIIVTSIVVTVGFTGWMGLALNQVNLMAPTIILTLAICDSVHLLVSYLNELKQGKDKVMAMTRAVKINLQPVFLTSLTTAIGFASLNFSNSPPFRELGTMCAVGVMGAMVLTLTLLPATMLALPTRNKGQGAGGAAPLRMAGIADFIIDNRKPVFWAVLVVVAVILSFAPRNELNDDTVAYFDERIEFRRAADFMQDNLTGFSSIATSLKAGEENGIYDPEFLRKVEDFAQWYRRQPGVVHVDSFTEIIKRLNRNMHGDDPAWHRIPDDRELIAQYVLLYELSLPFGLDMNTQVNFDKSATLINVRMKDMKSREMIDLEKRARQWLQENMPESVSVGSSVAMMFAHNGQSNIYSMMKGSVLALVLISLTLIIALRSVRFGLLSMLPNAFPAAMAFGFWGAFVAEVNLAVSAVFSITLGIVVDDTVHFMSKYLRARREGSSTEAAVRYAFTTVGAALVVTTVALSAGFALMAHSPFNVNASMGLMVAMTIVIALIFDLLFLPCVLMMIDKDKNPSDEVTVSH